VSDLIRRLRAGPWGLEDPGINGIMWEAADEIARLRAERTEFDCRFTLGKVADLSGIHCPVESPCMRCQNERLEAEIERLQVHSLARAHDIITLGQMVGKLEAEIEWLTVERKQLDAGVGRLREAFRVNILRISPTFSHAVIDVVLDKAWYGSDGVRHIEGCAAIDCEPPHDCDCGAEERSETMRKAAIKDMVALAQKHKMP